MPVLAQTLAGEFSAVWAIVGGLVAGLAFLMVVYGGLAMGMTRMNFLRILGTMMTPRASGGAAYTLGFVIHMMLSAVFGLVHAGLLHAIGVTSVGEAVLWDLGIGLVHGLAIVAMMPPMLTMMHPLVKNGEIESPGVAMVGFGSMTPVGSIMAHVVYGLVAGAIYAAAVL